jgi:ribbon-helix-helix protein
MPRKKITTTIYITEDQNEKLKALNQQTKVPIAEYIRQGIDLILDRHRAELPGEQLSFLNLSSNENKSSRGS